jgi:hypothetical protein
MQIARKTWNRSLSSKTILRTEDRVRIGRHGSYPRFRELQKLPGQNGTQQEPNTPSFSSPTPTQLRRQETGILSGGPTRWGKP